MMVKRVWLLLVIISFFNSSLLAQIIKTDVLIIGGNLSGVSAAIQSSRSGVKTMLVEETGQLGGALVLSDTTFKAGLAAEFIKHLKDTTSFTPNVSAALTSAIFKRVTDTVKNLTVQLNTGWQQVKKSGKGWDVKLKGGKTIRCKVLVDASTNSRVASVAGVSYDPATKSYKTLVSLPTVYLLNPYESKIYRTSGGIGKDEKTGMPFILPLGSLIAAGQENFLFTGKQTLLQSSLDIMQTGQAAGATAAFFAFFETTTKNLNVRVIQGELLNYKSWLIPYSDIQFNDFDFSALQHIGITGLLKARQVNDGLRFDPDSTVSSEELRPVMREFYSRSQIWFVDKKPIQKLTIEDVISLIKYTANRGGELDREIEKAWSGSFDFDSKFDLNKTITRRELAVLFETYLKPFNVRIDVAGNLLN